MHACYACRNMFQISLFTFSLRTEGISQQHPFAPTSLRTNTGMHRVYIPIQNIYNASGGTAFNVLITSLGAIWLFCKLLT
jgi:hypothetical protein